MLFHFYDLYILIKTVFLRLTAMLTSFSISEFRLWHMWKPPTPWRGTEKRVRFHSLERHSPVVHNTADWNSNSPHSIYYRHMHWRVLRNQIQGAKEMYPFESVLLITLPIFPKALDSVFIIPPYFCQLCLNPIPWHRGQAYWQ